MEHTNNTLLEKTPPHTTTTTTLVSYNYRFFTCQKYPDIQNYPFFADAASELLML